MTALQVAIPDYMQDPELEMFADSVAKFFQREAPAKRVEEWREAGQVERDIWTKAGEAGLMGVSVPAEYGGAGGDFRHDIVIFQQLVRNEVDGFGLQLHNGIVVPYIVAHGTEEQKHRWLPRLCSGERITAIAMSEPGAGSDLAAIRTTAVKDNGGYRINGSKTFISNGQLADFVVVVARTDPSLGNKGISLLVVETDAVEGFRRGKKLDKIGHDAQDTSELYFDDVWVPADNLLGGEEGRGFYQLMKELPKERLMMAINGVETMDMAIAATVEYTRSRKAFGQPIYDFQNTQFKLAECRAKAVVARRFVEDCVRRLLDGTLDGTTSAIAKMWVTDTECRIVDECLQLHGGYGYVNEYPIARMYRNSRVQRIYGGSNEIMKVIIARSL
ncbi:acyl-CoA dehydrogenase family protein [Novosphingobium sp. BL-52-GroH]|uniref:acyl-CoA dehydrogenase family protein n=1 Tax=Novosphingobium sp. BL-52-GroH TaxID=3349877 RepID=UPI00384C6F2C